MINHQSVADRIETLSMIAGVLAGLSAAGSVLAEPSGLSAFGVWLGLVEQPLIISAAPVLADAATVLGTLSGVAFFWAKWKKRQTAIDGND